MGRARLAPGPARLVRPAAGASKLPHPVEALLSTLAFCHRGVQ